MVPAVVVPAVRLGIVTVSEAAEKLTLQLNVPAEVFLQVVAFNAAGTVAAPSVAAPTVD
jgi:hypothetical protein